MTAINQVQALENQVNELLTDLEGYFLVDLYIKPTNNVKIFVDADQGASIDELTKLNRKLYRQLEEQEFFGSMDFSLEVSSPGLDEPLKLPRQYRKNLGRPVEVILKSGIKYEGTLVDVTEEEIRISEEKGHKKKKEVVEHQIPTSEIKSTKIQIKF